jgi:hypothetical protein
MTLPDSYTADSLAAYLHGLTELAYVDEILQWSIEDDSYEETINDTLILLKSNDLTSFNGMAGVTKVRTAGEVALWRRVLIGMVTMIPFSGGQSAGSYSRDQMVAHVRALLSIAEIKATAAGVDVSNMPPARVGSVEYNDPYAHGYSSVYATSRPRRVR